MIIDDVGTNIRELGNETDEWWKDTGVGHRAGYRATEAGRRNGPVTKLH